MVSTDARHAALAHGLAGTVSGLGHTLFGVFSGLGVTAFAREFTRLFLASFFRGFLTWVAGGAATLVGALATALSSTTEPVLSTAAFRNEAGVMAVLAAGVALPLLCLGAIQAVARQDPGTLLRSALLKMPLAILFTGVAIQLVRLGLLATDQASATVLGATGGTTHQMLSHLIVVLGTFGGPVVGGFGALLVVTFAAAVSFVLWFELAVRSAAISAAALFLPLALIGLAWPATSHWARRLGETLAALIFSKLAIAAVLALSAGLVATPTGLAGVVTSVALLAMAALAPFGLLKLIPVVESGAASHLEGVSSRPAHALRGATRSIGMAAIESPFAARAASGTAGQGASRMPLGGPTTSGRSPEKVLDDLGEGPFAGDRQVAPPAISRRDPVSPGADAHGG